MVMEYLDPRNIILLRRVCKTFDATIQLSDAQIRSFAQAEPKGKTKLYQLLVPENITANCQLAKITLYQVGRVCRGTRADRAPWE